MEWINVNDRLPSENTDVLCYYLNPFMDKFFPHIEILTYKYKGEHTFYGWHDLEIENVSHWMPLPSPPDKLGNFI